MTKQQKTFAIVGGIAAAAIIGYLIYNSVKNSAGEEAGGYVPAIDPVTGQPVYTETEQAVMPPPSKEQIKLQNENLLKSITQTGGRIGAVRVV